LSLSAARLASDRRNEGMAASSSKQGECQITAHRLQMENIFRMVLLRPRSPRSSAIRWRSVLEGAAPRRRGRAKRSRPIAETMRGDGFSRTSRKLRSTRSTGRLAWCGESQA